MTTSAQNIRRLPYVKADQGTLKGNIREMPGDAGRWEKGVAVPQYTVVPQEQMMDMAGDTAGTVVCRPADWWCTQRPSPRTVSTFFPTVIAAVDGCEPDDEQDSLDAVREVLSLDGSPLARYVWTGRTGYYAGVAVNHKALASDVVTLVTSAHTLSADDVVYVDGLGAPFDGLHVVASAADSTHITYAAAGDDVSNVADAGTVFKSFDAPTPGLSDGTVLAGTHNPVAALARLTKAARDAGYYGQLWFHCPEWLVPAYSTIGMLTVSGNALLLDGGHLLIADPGYPGSGPDGEEVDDAETFMWVSPPLFGATRAWKAPELWNPNAVDAPNCSFARWAIGKNIAIALWNTAYVFGTKVYWDATHGSAT